MDLSALKTALRRRTASFMDEKENSVLRKSGGRENGDLPSTQSAAVLAPKIMVRLSLNHPYTHTRTCTHTIYIDIIYANE